MSDEIKFIIDYQFPKPMLDRVQSRLDCNDFHMNILQDALKDYLIARFLFLHKGPVTMPSVSVDELWHEFIIFTRDYHSFCSIVYGEYLHHDPYGKFDIRTSSDEGLKNLLSVLSKIKEYTHYNSDEMNTLKSISDFHLLFAADYLLKNTPYQIVLEESLKDMKGFIS